MAQYPMHYYPPMMSESEKNEYDAYLQADGFKGTFEDTPKMPMLFVTLAKFASRHGHGWG